MSDNNFSIEWVGLKEFQGVLEDIVKNVDKANAAGIVALAALVESGAKNNFEGAHKRGAPHVGGPKPNIVTGNLRRSITRTGIMHPQPMNYMTTVYPNAVYARAVEMGTDRSRAFPYFAPAVHDMSVRATEIMTGMWAKYI